MKKTICGLLVAIMLVVTLAIPMASAEQAEEDRFGFGSLEAIIKSLFPNDGEGDPKEYSLENTVKDILISIQDKAAEKGVEIEDLLDEWLGKIKNEIGEIDLESIGSLIGDFFGFGSESDDEEVTLEEFRNSPYILEREARDAAVDAYIIDEYKDTLEPGDVQIVIKTYATNAEDDPLYNLGYFMLINFTAEGTDLKFKNSAANTEYLAFEKNEAGEYILIEAIPAEEGEGYADSVTALCEKFGITADSFYDEISQMNIDYYKSSELLYFLQNHPEYERIEYQGELKTLDEMQQVFDDALTVIFSTAFADFDFSDADE